MKRLFCTGLALCLSAQSFAHFDNAKLAWKKSSCNIAVGDKEITA